MKRLTLLILLFTFGILNMTAQQNVNITVNPDTKPKETKVRSGIVTLYGYLKVITNELGYFEKEPITTIDRINQEEQYSYDTWRLPSDEEIEILRANGYAKKDVPYMTSANRSNGNVILVTDQDKASVIRQREDSIRAARQKQAADEWRAQQYEKRRKIAQMEQQRLDSLKSLTGWCDLGLPSGTLWGYQGKGDLYREFAMLYYEDELPTESQWHELIDHCSLQKVNDKGDYILTGKNGKSMLIHKWEGFYLPEPLGEFGEMNLINFNEDGCYRFQSTWSEYKYQVLTVRNSSCPELKQMNNYVDLGLPSGTKWAYKDYSKTKIGSYTAENLLTSIPRKKQWKELQKYCKWEKREYGYKVIGPNGNWIFLLRDRYFCRSDKYGSKDIFTIELLSKKKVQILYGDDFVRINKSENRVRLISQ